MFLSTISALHITYTTILHSTVRYDIVRYDMATYVEVFDNVVQFDTNL